MGRLQAKGLFQRKDLAADAFGYQRVGDEKCGERDKKLSGPVPEYIVDHGGRIGCTIE